MAETFAVAVRQASAVATVEDCIALPQGSKLAKLSQADSEATYKSVGLLLAAMVARMHIANGLTDDDVRSIARRLTTDDEIRWWLTLADIDLLCRRIADGYYGEFYGHFSTAEFNRCLCRYAHERQECHRLEADKTASRPDPTLSVKEVGYTIDADGRLQVSQATQEHRLDQPLYLYDDKGRRTGVNPKGRLANSPTERMRRAAEGLAKARDIMRKHPEQNLTLDEALDIVEGKRQLNPVNN